MDLMNSIETKMEQSMSNKLTIYTDGSTAPTNPGPSGYGFHAVRADQTYDGFGPVGTTATNNRAEMVAVIKALEYSLAQTGVTSVDILSDSKYIVNNLKYVSRWRAADWTLPSGNSIKNIDEWILISNKISELEGLGVQVSIKWVKGHVGIAGNERADANANLGRVALAEQGVVQDVVQSTTESATVPKVKKAKKPVINPLLSGKRLFMKTNVPSRLKSGEYLYCTTSYLDRKEDKGKNAGKNSAQSHLGITICADPIVELEVLKTAFERKTEGAIIPTMSDLTLVTKADTWIGLTNPETRLSRRGGLVVSPENVVLGTVVNPPLLIYKLEQQFLFGLKILQEHTTNNDYTSLDVTDYFFESVKDKQKIAPAFKQELRSITIDVSSITNKKSNITLTLGVDIPVRGNFLAMARIKYAPPTSVKLVVWDVTKRSLRCAIVISHNDSTAIFYTANANYKLI